MPKSVTQPTHDYALDGLRGIAILLVLLMHTLHFQPTWPLWSWINAIAKAGWIGVDLFFVLSGFLITRILLQLREAPNRLGVFYGRRALRILPSYFVYLLITVPILLVFAEPAYVKLTLDMLPWLLVFLQNFHSAFAEPGVNLGPLSHLWSLAVEEQFYLFWPFVVWRVRTEYLARVALAFWVLAVLFKLLLAAMQAVPQVPYLLTVTRMDGFAAGACLAVWMATGKAPLEAIWLRLIFWLATLLLLTAFVVNRSGAPANTWMMVLCLSLTPLVFAGVLRETLISLPNSLLRRLLGQRILVFFGRHSYALYLVHAGVSVFFVRLLLPLLKESIPSNTARLIVILLTWLASIALSLLVDRWIDAPARRLKRRVRPMAALSSEDQAGRAA